MIERDFAKSSQEAQERYNRYQSEDPFPDIKSSLLNSADFEDYIRVVGMIHPYHSKNKKPATYGLRLLGPVIYWNESSKRIKSEIKEGDKFILPSNSIAFVTLEQEIRLPDYIAVRFNLKIKNIYRGILLGTGPIIDPGFCGRLSIPLHNLTSNDYEFEGGETLIWMEFTKVSDNKRWINRSESVVPQGAYKEFDRDGREGRTVEDYLKEAYHGSIESSLPNLAKETKEAIKTTQKITERADTQLGRINWVVGLSFVAILGMVATIVSLLHSDLREVKRKYDQDIEVLKSKISQDTNEITNLKRQVRTLNTKVGIKNEN